MIEIAEVAGARPNFMKVAPVHRAMLAGGRLRPRLIHTGQHYDIGLSEAIIRDLELPEPEFHLDVGSGSHAEQTARIMLRLEPLLRELGPAAVLVVGDVNSTLAGALTAAKVGIPVVHVEAGLRSYDRTMPEELNRVLTDALSDLLFAPSPDAVENLAREGIEGDRVHLVGNVMIDTLDALLPRARESDVLQRLGVRPAGYFLATAHRPSNVDDDDTLREVVDLLAEVASVLPVILPAHPRTRKRLEDTGLLAGMPARGVTVIDPLGYVDFLALMVSAAGVLTDSGGIQEETTVLGVPCLTLRDRTERPITVTEGTNLVVGLDRTRVLEEVTRIAAGERPEPRRPSLWDGRASGRICGILESVYAQPR